MPEHLELRLPDDVRLHVEATGPRDAEVTVILLHGWTLDGRAWHHQLAHLRERFGDRVRVVSYDARGHGRSSCMPLRTATLAQLGDDLAAVVDEVAPTGRVVLVGHSMGGMTVMEYAHRHPAHFAARTTGLVFVSTTAEGHTHTVYGLSPRIARLIRLAETTGAGVLARCGSWRPPRALLRALRPSIRWMLFGDRSEAADIRLVTSAVARASLRSIGGFRASIGAQHRLDTLAELAHLPAAALVGDRDRLTPPPCAESIAAALPTTELTVCPGAGHMLMMERPDEVNAALTGVLRQVLERPGLGGARTGTGDAPAAGVGTAG
ncbi:Pimeloyl-ACP methyl ester carboxylesterase [Micromonospora rhizosphaerae]|uniref:Pimeloyl-ACP methyl ester carboxylesterase n=1 Tax=Micromonospora rhizosphaerae TaxID=568872 RepID=A0A1C6T8Q0_9ACTN|nr:alpha/beta hydrolase [Micromonospora rhizosphaerae]SCL38190.1 Pimeloyl-ACP methyl ester carboxylesterase [Micromonospora rhizosphaerae]